jgi:hypothetical protein
MQEIGINPPNYTGQHPPPICILILIDVLFVAFEIIITFIIKVVGISHLALRLTMGWIVRVLFTAMENFSLLHTVQISYIQRVPEAFSLG